MTPTDRKRAAAPLLTILAATFFGAPAHADCGEPPLELLWTYPSDGAQNVPVNAEFWTLTSLWGAEVEATLNGIALEATRELNAMRFEPASLAPDTDYTLHVSVPSHAEVSSSFDIHFRTGSDTASAPSAPAVLGHATASELGGTGCPDVILAQDCFDTGQNTLLSFRLAESDAIAWLVKTEEGYGAGLSPAAACSAPALFVGDYRPPGCYELHSVGPGGLLSPPTRFCAESGAAPDAGAVHDAGNAESEGAQDGGNLGADAGPAHHEEPPHPGFDSVIRIEGCSMSVPAVDTRFGPLLVALASLAFALQRRRRS